MFDVTRYSYCLSNQYATNLLNSLLLHINNCVLDGTSNVLDVFRGNTGLKIKQTILVYHRDSSSLKEIDMLLFHQEFALLGVKTSV